MKNIAFRFTSCKSKGFSIKKSLAKEQCGRQSYLADRKVNKVIKIKF